MNCFLCEDLVFQAELTALETKIHCSVHKLLYRKHRAVVDG